MFEIEAVELMTETEFRENESVINQGKQTFIDVGKALVEIRDRKGYRFQYGTFEDYCINRWGWSVRTGYNMIAAAKTAENVQSLAQLDYTKASLLSTVPEEKQAEFAKQNPISDMTTRQLQAAIKAQKEAEHKAQEAEQRANNLAEALKNQKPIEKEVVKEVVPPEVKKKAEERDHIAGQYSRLYDENKKLKFELECKQTGAETRLDLSAKVSRFAGKIRLFLADAAPLGYLGRDYMRASSYAQEEYENSLDSLEKWIKDVRSAMIRPDKATIIDAEVLSK